MANAQETALAIANLLSPPGETLQEALEERGMKQKELARRTGRPVKTINEIVRGKAAITYETARQFELVLGIPASFWMAREQHYQEAVARMTAMQRLSKYTGWLKNFPIDQMIRLNWIARKANLVDQLQELLLFFGIAAPEIWEDIWNDSAVAFRRSAKVPINEYTLSAWLQQGERQAHEIACQPYDERRFRQTLHDLRTLSASSPEMYMQQIVQQCAKAGVAVVYVPTTGLKLATYGATYWLSSTKAVIQFSLYGKEDGHFWFTLFHEAGHIVLHGKKAIFIEDDQPRTEQEAEADTFAAEQLIPMKTWQRFITLHPRLSKDAILAFARELGIAPGIIVGRLQHEGKIPHKDCNGLKRRIRVPEFPED